ncbi:DUF4840 domain-containing protein [Chryseobacterium gossypii]|uniref:DUF4840 domain-containing protein n=1 Tax=Chryseobacterium gossypii TaxID=3231602 RepID=UPI00352321DB
MKKSVLQTLFVVLAVLLGFSVTSCNDDYEVIPVKLEDVNGSYKAKLVTTQGNKRAEKIVDFTAKDTVITFREFPIREIVKSVVTDPVKAEAALTAIGKIEYKLDYTPKLHANNNVVELTFAPETLEFQIPVDGTNKNVAVDLDAKQKGFYVGQDWSLRFGLVAEKITVDGVVLAPFETIKYDFPYCIKN